MTESSQHPERPPASSRIQPFAYGNLRLLGFVGAALLFVGSFLPMLSVPLLGTINYFANGKGDGVLMIVLAVVAGVLAARRRFRALLIPGLASLALLAFTLVLLINGIHEIRQSLSGTNEVTRGLAGALSATVQLQWGWAILVLGAVVLIGVALTSMGTTRGPTSSNAGVIGGAVVTAAVVVGLGIANRRFVEPSRLGLGSLSSSDSTPNRLTPDSSHSSMLRASTGTVRNSPGWRLRKDTSMMDRRESVFLMLHADSSAADYVTAKTPILGISCVEGQTDVTVSTGMPAQTEEENSNRSSVRIRLDSGTPQQESWSQFLNNGILMSPDPIAFARRLASAEKFYVEFTPFSRSTEVAVFTLRDLRTRLPAIAEACSWPHE